MQGKFCWHCSGALETATHRMFKVAVKEYYVKTQDGHAVRVHRACVQAAVASVRQLTAQDPDFARGNNARSTFFMRRKRRAADHS